ncbi:hypothetical protein D9M70_569880 [compost metagenome]
MGDLSHARPPDSADAAAEKVRPRARPMTASQPEILFFIVFLSSSLALCAHQWAAKTTRSGTVLNSPLRLHHGISRKKPK